jgi:hypothetical protein
VPLARASQLDRLLACPGSGYLPQIDLRGARAHEAAAWGTMCHRWVETGEIGHPGLQKKLDASGASRDALWPGGSHEVALAYNVLTGEARSFQGDGKDEWKAAFDNEWVVGTLDYVDEVFGEPWVDDLKTGRRVTWEAYEAQQTFYALAWSKANYGDRRRTRSTLTHWPRYPLGGLPFRFGKVIEAEELEHFEARLREMRAAILSQGPRVVGPQCTYCPSRTNCNTYLNEGVTGE